MSCSVALVPTSADGRLRDQTWVVTTGSQKMSAFHELARIALQSTAGEWETGSPGRVWVTA